MFWNRLGYINTIHCCCFWVLQKKKASKTGYVYEFGIFSFLFILFVCFCSTESYILKHSFPFYLLQDIVLPLSGDFGTMDPQQQRKNAGEHGTYIICYVPFYIILYIPTTHHNCISSSFHCCWRVEMMAYFLFTYYCKWGWHTNHFFTWLIFYHG